MSVKWFPNDKFGLYGLDELRWLKPVKPDDTLRVSMEIKDLRRSKSRPSPVLHRVIFKQLTENEIVMTMNSAWILK